MASDPIDSIRKQIEAAISLPEAQPYVPSLDPLDQLRRQLRGEPANDDQPRPKALPPATGIEGVIGREVLAMMADQPLPAAARAEAVRRLGRALEDPTPANIRAVLSVILSGRADG